MPRKPQHPECLSRRLSYQGRKFGFEVATLRLPNGVEGELETIRHPGGAMAVPVAADGRFVLVRQYRFPMGEWLLEFPAGTVEAGEAPEGTIRRELEEETGFRAHHWDFLGDFPLTPGYSDEYIHAYLARELEPLDDPPAQDDDEDLETVLLTGEELMAAARAGEADAKTLGGYLLVRGRLG
ncbi:NUDIX hydrolase [Thiohalorhabdus denitrificans]|uniref:GDP-mannose pyrophosphatase n=1 Tax=Thiohalorhabdus denitrificans TaxID=381306 RepID=A0A0P9CXH0_9GAMM|nr:NUDIX hydrolase [Thiohalorhabdus denitrificans]KPV41547.1 NUDIX hydrolase [Thiohalorhabdus denitrificans]SCY31256.1 ADP-ribose pyrophosphatase [Thiohalorhabdus denitrificans]